MTKTFEINPVFAKTLGYDLKAASNKDVVTMVRRRVVLEEVVISKEQYDKINSDIDDGGIYWNELDWKDAQWSDYNEENTEYTAFPGDVTSFSDDCVSCYKNQWRDCYERIPLNTFER